jgi:hypothetical protein
MYIVKIPQIGDTVKWKGIFNDGYKSGKNIVTKHIYDNLGFFIIELDNDMTFIILDLKNMNKPFPVKFKIVQSKG